MHVFHVKHVTEQCYYDLIINIISIIMESEENAQMCLNIDAPHEERKRKKRKSKRVYSTRYSQAVTHPSTNRARRCLTSVIGREPVLST